MFLFLAACGSDEVKEDVASCCICLIAVTAPGWICDEPVDGVEVSAVGVAFFYSRSTVSMKNMAATDARVPTSQSMKVHVSEHGQTVC